MTALDKRKLCIQRRSSLSNSKRFEKEKAITNCVLPFLKGKIGTYIPIRNEVDVYAKFRDEFDLYIPKMLDDTTIAFYSDREEKSKMSRRLFVSTWGTEQLYSENRKRL